MTAWHREVLPGEWTEAALDLASRRILDGFYLAGGTGLALQFGHRRSVDLDLFHGDDFDEGGLRDRLVGLPDLKIQQIAPGTLHLELRRTLVSFLSYPYPLLFPLLRFEALNVADARDIACMKLDAVANRGSRRDFVDLYVASRQFGLSEILDWFEKKYAATPYNRMHLLKALSYFADAEREPMPDMLVPLDWTSVKTFFTREVPRLF